MVFVEKAVCPDWQASELAVKNDEVIHDIHGWWLRDVALSAKGSCPSAGCGMSCAEGWQLPLDVMASLWSRGVSSWRAESSQPAPRLYSRVPLLTKHPSGSWSRRTSQQLSSLVEKQGRRGNLSTSPAPGTPALQLSIWKLW